MAEPSPGEPRAGWPTGLRFAIPVVVVGALAVIKPEIVRGTFSSAGSVLRVAAVIAAWVLFSWLMRRVIPNPLVRTTVVAVPAAVLLWFTVVPYFQEEPVDDALPMAPAATPEPATTAPAVPADGSGSAAAPPPSPAPTAAAGPVKVSTGQLRGLDGHEGAGEAAVYRQADGALLVRLEDFDVSNTPGPVLYLVPGAGRESPTGGTKLGALRGSQGNQNFTVPAGTEVGAGSTVLIWCEPFAVAVAGATQSPV